MSNIQRLDEAIRAVCPIDGVSVGIWGNVGTVSIAFSPSATTQQRTDAQNAVNTFDWSQAAEDTWLNLKLRSAAVNELGLTTQLAKLMKAVAGVIADELNILRQQVIGTNTLVFDPPNLTTGTGATSSNITVTGTLFGDIVDVGAPYTLQGIVAVGFVVAADTVAIRLQNGTGSTINLASGTWNVCVRRPITMSPRTLAQAKTAIINKLNSGAAD